MGMMLKPSPMSIGFPAVNFFPDESVKVVANFDSRLAIVSGVMASLLL
jgi:hypothetical protein